MKGNRLTHLLTINSHGKLEIAMAALASIFCATSQRAARGIDAIANPPSLPQERPEKYIYEPEPIHNLRPLPA